MARRGRLHNQRPFDISDIEASLHRAQGSCVRPTNVVEKVTKPPKTAKRSVKEAPVKKVPVVKAPAVPSGVDAGEIHKDIVERHLAIGRAVLNAPSFSSLKPSDPRADGLDFGPHADGMRVLYVPEEEIQELSPAAVWWLRERVTSGRANKAELRPSMALPFLRLLWRTDPEDSYATNVYAAFSLEAGRPLNAERVDFRRGLTDTNRPALMCLLGVVIGDQPGADTVDDVVRGVVSRNLETQLCSGPAGPLLHFGPVSFLEPNRAT